MLNIFNAIYFTNSLCAFFFFWFCFLQPPPPELGYTITVKDLDEEKKAAISKIQKILETPGEY